MKNAAYSIPKPYNEPCLGYLAGSPERKTLKAELERQKNNPVRVPIIIGGREIYTDRVKKIVAPHDHTLILGEYCLAGEAELKLAIEAALEAKQAWADMPWEHRAGIFLKAAELLSGPRRALLNASTMLGQSKTAYQAEIDAACELIDFLRFNPYFAQQIFSDQPQNSRGVWNREVYRPLDGFVTAVSPFNFTSIGGNLCTAPAMLGNTVLWKPSSTSVLSNYYFMKILMEAGLPGGVINFIPSSGADVGRHVLSHPKFAGFHFTGSTEVFRQVWAQVGNNIGNYATYPRLVGETGGKDFIFAHPDADRDALLSALIRGAFEYQGQKCSAASRAYIPESMWEDLKTRLTDRLAALKVGDVCEFDTFMGAVIDQASFKNIAGYIDEAKTSPDAELVCGGYEDKTGYFVSPTVIRAKNPLFRSMVEEIFGPVLTVYVYPDDKLAETLSLCADSSTYALTGAIFGRDRNAIVMMENRLMDAAGNLYINDKPTGAVVGQQPFGGARASGTNDKAGSAINLYRWLSACTIKENLCPTSDITYPYMSEK